MAFASAEKAVSLTRELQSPGVGPTTSLENGKRQKDEEQRQQLQDDSEEKCCHRIRGSSWAILVVAVLSSTFLYAFDNTVMANVRPSIIQTFPDSIEKLPWMSISYPLGEVGGGPLWGKLYGQFENKHLFLAALLIFETGSAVIGSAQSIEALIAGRAVSGFGGSGIYVGTINIVSAMTGHAKRSQYLGLVGVAWGFGTMLGPILGGLFADSDATWRWAFYINICVAGVAAPASIYLIPLIHPETQVRSRRERIMRIDYLGALLFLGGVASIIMVLGFGGSVYAWREGRMIGLCVATGVIWLAFGLQQGYSLLALDRIFPVQFAVRLETVIMFGWTANAISSLVVPIYSLPLFFQFAFGDSSVRSAAYTLPSIVAAVVSAGAGGPLVARFPTYKPWFAAGGAVMLLGSALLTTIDYGTSRGVVCGYSVIQGLGTGAMIQLPLTVAQVKTPPAEVPQVTAFMTCAQMGGLALALGISTCIFINRVAADITTILPGVPRATVQALIDGAGTDLLEGLRPAAQERVLAAIAKNVAQLFYLNLAGSALGLLSSLAMKYERLALDP